MRLPTPPDNRIARRRRPAKARGGTRWRERGPVSTNLYRSVWRWHFYAGLIVLPVLAWLAITGALYLYKPELERRIYADWIVRAAPGPALDADLLVAAVERQTRARVAQLVIPADPGETWRATIARGDARQTAFVDPGSGAVRGVTTRDGGALALVRDLHSLALTGPVGNALIEIVAGWTILLVLTGFYLWWPRRGAPALALRGRPAGRLFWRDLHASSGALVGAILLFLALTGMPWSIVWGAQLERLVTAEGIGRPPRPVAAPAHATHEEQAAATLPWSLRHQAMPDHVAGADIGPARVLAVAARHGLVAPLALTRPRRPDDPYVVSSAAPRAEAAHVLFVASDGRVLQDARARDFGVGARAIEWGIAVHQGQQYGEPNRLLMLAGCLGVLLLAATAPVLWWKRRFAPPPAPDDGRRSAGLTAIMLALGALFPLTGATMVAALLCDRLRRA